MALPAKSIARVLENAVDAFENHAAQAVHHKDDHSQNKRGNQYDNRAFYQLVESGPGYVVDQFLITFAEVKGNFFHCFTVIAALPAG